MARVIHSHPAPLVLVYDWQGGEFARRLGGIKGYSREHVGELIDAGHRLICYQAEIGEEKRNVKTEGFDWFCDMSFEVSGALPGRKLFVIDECHDLISPQAIPEGLSEILSRGGRREMDTLIAGAAPNALHNEARNQISELFCFRCLDKRALEFQTSLGMDADEIKNLKDTEFLHRDMRTGEHKKLALWEKKSRQTKEQ